MTPAVPSEAADAALAARIGASCHRVAAVKA
jgi:hypothetical protein